MNFREKEIVNFRDNWGYLRIVTVCPAFQISTLNLKSTISEFLKTKYFIWNYEGEPTGQNVIVTQENGEMTGYSNEKFYGFYETGKLEYFDFKSIDFKTFEKNIKQAILQETDAKFLKKCSRTLQRFNPNSLFFYLNPPENKIPKIVKDWPIYTYFYAYLIIELENNEISLVEFGLD